MCASKKGISALQLQRVLELGSYRSAWFMAHRTAALNTDESPLYIEPGKSFRAHDIRRAFRAIEKPKKKPAKNAKRSTAKKKTAR
jgi:hypothetical protein